MRVNEDPRDPQLGRNRDATPLEPVEVPMHDQAVTLAHMLMRSNPLIVQVYWVPAEGVLRLIKVFDPHKEGVEDVPDVSPVRLTLEKHPAPEDISYPFEVFYVQQSDVGNAELPPTWEATWDAARKLF